MGDEGKKAEAPQITSIGDINAQRDHEYEAAAFLSFVKSDSNILGNYVNKCNDEAMEQLAREEEVLNVIEKDPQMWREIDPALLLNNSTLRKKLFHKNDTEKELDKNRDRIFTEALYEFLREDVLSGEEYHVYQKFLKSFAYKDDLTSFKAYEYVIYQIGKNEDIAKEMLSRAGKILSILPEEYRANKEMVKIAVWNDGSALGLASEELKGDEEVVLMAIEQNANSLQFASEELRNDSAVVTKAVSKWGLALEYASKQVQGNLGVVVEAIGKEASILLDSALKYVPKEILNDPRIIRMAVRNNLSAMEYASVELKKDKVFVLELIQNYGIEPENIDPSLYDDRDIALASVIKRGDALEYFPKFFDDREVVIQAVKNDGNMLLKASNDLQEDIEIVRLAIGNNARIYKELPEKIKNNMEVIILAITGSDDGLWFELSDEVKSSNEIIEAIIEHECLSFYPYIPRSYWNKDKVMSALQNGLGIFYMLPEEWENKAYVLEFMIHNDKKFLEDYQFTWKQLENPSIAKAVILDEPSNIRKIDEKILTDKFVKEVVKQNPNVLWYIDDWTESLLMAAVSTGKKEVINIMEDDSELSKINWDVRERVYLAAIRRNAELLPLIAGKYVEDDILLELIQKDPKNIQYIWPERVTPEMIEYVIKTDASCVALLPKEQLEDPDFLIKAININPKVREFIPEKYIRAAAKKVQEGYR